MQINILVIYPFHQLVATCTIFNASLLQNYDAKQISVGPTENPTKLEENKSILNASVLHNHQ